MAELTGGLLASMGHRVTICTSAVEASVYRPGDEQIVFISVNGPEDDGTMLADWYRMNVPDTPLVIVADGQTRSAMSGMSRLWDGFLEKPFQFDQLQACVAVVAEMAEESSDHRTDRVSADAPD